MFLSKLAKNNIKSKVVIQTLKESINDYGTRMAINHMLGSLNNEEKAHNLQIYNNVPKKNTTKPILDNWTQEDIDYFDIMARKHAMNN